MESSSVKKGIQSFKSGLNCAQAVLTTYSERLGMDNEVAMSVSCGFGAGMGRMQETCGAVTGAFMAIGVYNCKKYGDNNSRKQQTYSMVQEFSNRFKSINGSTNCKALINCDLNTEEGQKYAHDNAVYEKICEKCVSDAIEIVHMLIDK